MFAVWAYFPLQTSVNNRIATSKQILRIALWRHNWVIFPSKSTSNPTIPWKKNSPFFPYFPLTFHHFVPFCTPAFSLEKDPGTQIITLAWKSIFQFPPFSLTFFEFGLRFFFPHFFIYLSLYLFKSKRNQWTTNYRNVCLPCK